MSDKPSPKPTAASASAKSAGNGGASTVKGSSATSKPKPNGPPEEFDFLAPARRPDEIGRMAHFRILKVVGRGGMSFVFMAEDTRLNRIVALKVMLPTIAKKPIARERFIREARATAQIEHDHIITIYEVESDREIPYAAMQFLKGMSLEDWLKAGKSLKVPQLLRIGKEIAKGLAAAHSHQLIHRDIKPSNIWLDSTNKGRVKILDFGLARPLAESTNLTQLGIILGTPAYMSPEQARSEPVDKRCDLFSLGCVLYRLCSGKLPFKGEDAMSMLMAITDEEPAPLHPLNPDVPGELITLIHKLLEKRPDDRPASAQDVVRTFQAIERKWVASAATVVNTPYEAAPPTDMTPAEEIDAVLEESAITEQEFLKATHTSVAMARPRSQRWLFAGMGCAGVVVTALLCCFGTLLATDHGEVEILAENEETKNKLENVELIAHDYKKGAHKLKPGVNRLRSGGYAFAMENWPADLKIEPPFFGLTRGETQKVSIRYEPPKPGKTAKTAKPPTPLMTSDQARTLQRDWAAYLRVDVTDSGSKVGPKLVLIPPGDFEMGSSDEQVRQYLNEFKKKFELRIDARRLDAEKPQHLVRISKPFYLSAGEVTNGQFGKFVFSAQYTTEAEMKGGGTGLEAGKEVRKPDYNWKVAGFTGSAEQPVFNVTLADADAYCKWLSKTDGKTYRLPTEAEWEYACRAGTTSHWSFGDDLRLPNVSAYMVFNLPGKGGKNPLPLSTAGSRRTNDFGLFDMHGNIAEMCSDYYDPAYYETCAREVRTLDPKGPALSPKGERVVRGGSFLSSPAVARSAYRDSVEPGLGHVHIGFRVVCEIPE